MGTENHVKPDVDLNSPDYLTQLLRDKKTMSAFPNVFSHIERLLDDEINRVRISLFHNKPEKQPMPLPDATGPIVTLTEKVWVPTTQYPEFNFVGRILGPRGMTLKDLESQTGCKIMVRGKGSMREKQKEDANRGKPSWEHLNENLHVLISVEDSRNRAELKLQSAIKEINKLLVPAEDGDDDLKKNQLLELAIFNGTYRNARDFLPQIPQNLIPKESIADKENNAAEAQRMLTTPGLPSPLAMPQLRSPAGAPIIFAPRIPMPTMNGALSAPPPLISPPDHTGLSAASFMFNPFDIYGAGAATTATAFSPTLLEYPPGLEPTTAGAVHKMRRTLTAADMRQHPYTRIVPMPGLSQ